jgi:acyl-coenzyme A thioesterase PaaI-like protein
MAGADDLDLLRRHEPLLRFTHGELFFPMAAESYVSSCDLLEGTTLRDASVVVPSGTLDLERLAAAADAPPGHSQFLRFVPRPLGSIELARWRNRPDRQVFSAPGRLARVGLIARLVDAGLVASLLLRGRVPGGTTAAASIRYEGIRERDPRVVYHGRVVREGRWVILHYMFLYAMNDWRSTFEGANDHEADLEQCFVVCEALDDGEVRPAWFCAAAHDEKGDDLRRRWDDPRLQVNDGHPLVFPGAGSHATYLEPGEYIMRLPFPGERNIRGPLELLRHIWRDTLDQPDPGDLAEKARRALSVPFVDYARGDGIAIGPGGDIDWTPIIIGDEDGWVDRYKGLWGLDTGDRFAGERAPAGPKYTRTGTVRQSWHDPLGFAGLDKVAPPSQAVATLETRIAALVAERDDLGATATQLEAELPLLEAEIGAIREAAGMDAYRSARLAELRAGETQLAESRGRSVQLATAIDAGRRHVEGLRAGVLDDPRAHLRHAAEPEPPAETNRRALGEAWAAISVGVLVVALAVIVWFRILPPVLAIVVLLVSYLAVESFFRRDVQILLLRITIALALVSAAILAFEFAREVVLIGLLALGLLLIADNVGAMRRRRT